jgi:hypothetical protein
MKKAHPLGCALLAGIATARPPNRVSGGDPFNPRESYYSSVASLDEAFSGPVSSAFSGLQKFTYRFPVTIPAGTLASCFPVRADWRAPASGHRGPCTASISSTMGAKLGQNQSEHGSF